MKQIEKVVKEIERQLETEKQIHQSMSKFKECELKTVVRNQSIGAVRAYETALYELKKIQDDEKECTLL